MKAFIFGFQTNYDLGACIVYAETLEQAKEIADKDWAWDTNNVHEIDTAKYSNCTIVIHEDQMREVIPNKTTKN
jgi:hypothetical protein